MDLSEVSGSYPTNYSLEGALVSSQISGQEFFAMLLTELKNQDPFEPMKHSDLLAQLAQFSTLEQTEKISESMSELASSQRLAEGCGLIGFEIEYFDAETGGLASGVVSSVEMSGYDVYAKVGENLIPLDWIASVSSPTSTETDTETENSEE